MSYADGDIRTFRGKDMRGTGRGSNHRNAQLTEDQVREIKRALALPTGQRPSQPVLARRYGVSVGAINNISRRRNWSHVRIEEEQ